MAELSYPNRDQNPVLVFRTSIQTRDELKKLSELFDNYPSITSWNVDTEDRENILRIECRDLTANEIIKLVKEININAAEL